MGIEPDYIDGQTPLDEDEKEGLLVPTITTKAELDEYEQRNIERAVLWSVTHSIKKDKILTEEFVCMLHRRMFGNVWAWAGSYRKTNKNIGVDKWQILQALHVLLDDAKYWIANKTYPPDEYAMRFKHRLVSIHCFPNGNGRHSRLMADIIAEQLFEQQVYSWGAKDPMDDKQKRTTYLAAMKAADRGDMEPLIAFARQ